MFYQMQWLSQQTFQILGFESSSILTQHSWQLTHEIEFLRTFHIHLKENFLETLPKVRKDIERNAIEVPTDLARIHPPV